MAHAGGAPPKYTPEQRTRLLDNFIAYIQENDDPTVVWFVSHDPYAVELMLIRETMNNWDEFKPHIKRAIQKQESYLLKQDKNPTMSIFRLKQPQHGYKDRTEQAIDVTSGGNVVGATVDPRLVAGWTEYLEQHTLADGSSEQAEV